MKYKEANERKTTDAGIITVALLAARYFADNIESSLSLVRYTSLIPNIFNKSWVNRRLHKIGEVFSELFFYFRQTVKELTGNSTYCIDSFPVPVCQNI